MPFEDLLEILRRDFGLRENHEAIIRILAEGPGLTAQQICDATGIPKGRIYDYLNELIAEHLILKKPTDPAIYWIDDVEKRIYEFSARRFEDLIEKERRLLKKIYFAKATDVENLPSRYQYNSHLAKEHYIAEWINNIRSDGHYPLVFYPKSDDEYFSIKRRLMEREYLGVKDKMAMIRLRRARYQAMKEGKKVRFIISEPSYFEFVDSVKTEFGKSYLKERLQELNDVLKRYPNVKIRVLPKPISYDLFVSDKAVAFALEHRGILRGLIVHNPFVCDSYNQIFQRYYAEGKDVRTYIHQTLKAIK